MQVYLFDDILLLCCKFHDTFMSSGILHHHYIPSASHAARHIVQGLINIVSMKEYPISVMKLSDLSLNVENPWISKSGWVPIYQSECSCGIIRKIYVVFVPSSWYRAPKNLGISRVVRVLRGFPGGSVIKACNAGDWGSIPVSGRSPGGHGNPLQYSYLEYPMDWGGAWRATVQSVIKSWSWLKHLSIHAH